MATFLRSLRVGLTALVLSALVIGVVGPSEAAEGTVEYRLAWLPLTGGGSEPATFTSDLGYHITVEEALVTTYAVTLVACEHDHGFSWFGLFGVATASAGHATSGDAAQAGGPWVEDALASDVVMADAVLDEPAYCEAHVAFGADEGATLEVSGSYVAPGSTERVVFEISTEVDWGVKTALADASGSAVRAEPGEQLEVLVTRSLAGMFDGVDLATSTDPAIDLLRSLSAAVTATVTAGTAHA